MKTKTLLVLALAGGLSGCAGGVAWVHAHTAELVAVGLVAGTVSQVEGAIVNADEVARRAERRAGGE